MTTPLSGAGLSRRRFLQLGAIGSASLAVLGTTASLSGCSRPASPAAGFDFLSADDVAMLRALLPVANGSAYAAAAARNPDLGETALQRIDALCARMDPPAQAELRKLFDLLGWSLFRRLACGFSDSWSEAAPATLAAFLERWRQSSVGLFNAGHRGLVKLAGAGFWSQPATWAASTYPGPPAFAVSALNR